MFRIWGRTFKNNKMIKNTTIEIDNPEMTRTHKVFKALEDICEEFDLSNPIWLDNNIDEFKRISRTRFYQDSFIEHIDFDYLDFYIILAQDVKKHAYLKPGMFIWTWDI